MDLAQMTQRHPVSRTAKSSKSQTTQLKSQYGRSASIMEVCHGEIVHSLIRESGSAHVKAELEWQFVHAVTLEAASFPHRMEGRILPFDEAGKKSRAYRQPLGVIGVISMTAARSAGRRAAQLTCAFAAAC
jgi:acyl-CoA reductase-like NAD-dependent aldehyde dehydrogenase